MVFVTHSLGSARELCDRAIWLNKGIIELDGKTNEVIDKYLEETK
jgi:ABC-type polysaccharide/polyol phosphate transport system ATPase subunit